VDHGAFARHAIYFHGLLSFTQELNMRNQTHELSIDGLDEVSGGILSVMPAVINIPPVGSGSNFPGGPGSGFPGFHHHHHHHDHGGLPGGGPIHIVPL
jgi:hypothetical protein